MFLQYSVGESKEVLSYDSTRMNAIHVAFRDDSTSIFPLHELSAIPTLPFPGLGVAVYKVLIQ